MFIDFFFFGMLNHLCISGIKPLGHNIVSVLYMTGLYLLISCSWFLCVVYGGYWYIIFFSCNFFFFFSSFCLVLLFRYHQFHNMGWEVLPLPYFLEKVKIDVVSSLNAGWTLPAKTYGLGLLLWESFKLLIYFLNWFTILEFSIFFFLSIFLRIWDF